MSCLRTLSVQDFIGELKRIPDDAFTKVDPVREFLVNHPVDPASLQPSLFWDRHHYTCNLIHKTSLYELLAICWEVGQSSAIHNHNDQNCWMAVSVGKLIVQNYHILDQDLDAGRYRIEKADVIEMDPTNPVAVNPNSPVHKVFNPREFGNRAVSLHIYSRLFSSCTVFSEDQKTCNAEMLIWSTLPSTGSGRTERFVERALVCFGLSLARDIAVIRGY